jgi:polysaccharide biosynthesis/export protein
MRYKPDNAADMNLPQKHLCVLAPRVKRRRTALVRFILPALGALIAASLLVGRETRGRVAPTGVATPAGLRQADTRSARVASITPEERHDILLCQALGPAAPCNICGVDGSTCNCCRRGWEAARAIQWQAYAQGEYVGHARLAHVPEYRLRVDDQLDMTYRLTRDETATPYRLNVGDEVRVESFTDPELNRDLLLQPDGTITLRLLGQVHATGCTVAQLRDDLEQRYKEYYRVPAVTVTPLRVNTKLEDLRATIDRRAGIGGQSQAARVTPEGTIALPGIGSVQAQGLTLPELQTELNECYRQVVEGIQVIPILSQRAPRYVYVLGEVNDPGRFELTGPTTALQAISMAKSWRVGANLRQIVVFRRGDDWRLLATMIDLQAALLGNQPNPPGEIWIDDSDVIIVPKGKILLADDFIELVFTRGIYGVFPLYMNLNFSKMSTL